MEDNMCIQCHQNLSDTQLLASLQKEIDHPCFNKWNSTSISHLFIASIGFNGAEARDLANQLLDSYATAITDLDGQQRMGLDLPPTAEYINNIIAFSREVQRKFMEEGLSQQEIRERVLHDENVFQGYPQPAESDLNADLQPAKSVWNRVNEFNRDWLNPIRWWNWGRTWFSKND